jgi:hypothetical protein
VARRLGLALAVISLLAVLAAGPAQARRSYCAKSGDYCLAVVKRGGQIFLVIDSFAFRGSVELCVQSPDGKRRCRVFKLRRDPNNRDLYRSHVKWSDHFPHGQKGLYRVAWHYYGTKLPLVHFRIT